MRGFAQTLSIVLLVMGVTLANTGCRKGAKPFPATANLAFDITPPSGFAICRDNGKSKTYTLQGFKTKPGDAVLIIVRSSQVTTQENVRGRSAGQFIMDLEDFTKVKAIVTTPIVATQLPGYEATADAVASNVPVRVYCARFFSSDCTYTVLGHVSADKSTMIDSFRTAAHSLTFK